MTTTDVRTSAPTASPMSASDRDRRLADLLDRTEISGLVHRVGRCLDEGRFDELRSIVTVDVTASTPGGVAEGIDAVIAQASRNHTDDERIQHLITDVIVDLDGDDAVVRANLVVTFVAAADGGDLKRMGSVYRFDARRADGGWLLASIGTEVTWRERAVLIGGGQRGTGTTTSGKRARSRTGREDDRRRRPLA